VNEVALPYLFFYRTEKEIFTVLLVTIFFLYVLLNKQNRINRITCKINKTTKEKKNNITVMIIR